MTTKVQGTQGIEFPDSTQQATAADKGPAFCAVRTSPQGLTDGVAAVVIFDGILVNDGNAYNPTNGAFFAPKAGAYQFNTVVHFTGVSGSYAVIELYKNGQPLLRLGQVEGPMSNTSLSGSAVVDCEVNDYIQIYAQVGGSGANVGAIGSAPWITSFSGALVRKS